MNKRRLPLLVLAACGALWAGSASAQISTWNFADRTGDGACTGSFATNGNAINCETAPSGTTTTLQARAYSTTSATVSGAYETAAINDQGASGFGAGNRIEGYGVTGEPNHAFDSAGGSFDALLLDFEGVARALSSVTIGWSGSSYDADFQVLRWTGATNATISTVQSSIVGKTGAQLVSGSWQLVSSVDGWGGISTPDVAFGVNAGQATSSYWLISAYNTSIGTASGLTAGDESFKIVGVTTGFPPTTSVSAPGTLALAGLGLIGAGAMRRRRA